MALTHLASYDALLGTGAQNTGSSSSVVAPAGAAIIPITNLGTGGDVTSPDVMIVEGFILALLQKANDVVVANNDPNSVLDINKSSSFVTTRAGLTVLAERYTVTIYQATTLPNLDPDTV